MHPLLQWKSNKCYRVCVCSMHMAHAMCMCHIVMWPVRIYNIFTHYLINVTIFEIIEHEICVLNFSTTFVSNASHSKK